ncbi:MAG: hypothetical protein MGG11_18670 [Trichodesmium sp. MAG_R03]|nr:hypothetical protein [Trichodesmium sp. MAG_R03]
MTTILILPWGRKFGNGRFSCLIELVVSSTDIAGECNGWVVCGAVVVLISLEGGDRSLNMIGLGRAIALGMVKR